MIYSPFNASTFNKSIFRVMFVYKKKDNLNKKKTCEIKRIVLKTISINDIYIYIYIYIYIIKLRHVTICPAALQETVRSRQSTS